MFARRRARTSRCRRTSEGVLTIGKTVRICFYFMSTLYALHHQHSLAAPQRHNACHGLFIARWCVYNHDSSSRIACLCDNTVNSAMCLKFLETVKASELLETDLSRARGGSGMLCLERSELNAPHHRNRVARARCEVVDLSTNILHCITFTRFTDDSSMQN